MHCRALSRSSDTSSGAGGGNGCGIVGVDGRGDTARGGSCTSGMLDDREGPLRRDPCGGKWFEWDAYRSEKLLL